jgi:hypothetical protein
MGFCVALAWAMMARSSVDLRQRADRQDHRAAAATSDVEIADHRVGRLVLAHTILAFLFNTTVLALAINVGASLV